MLDEIETLLTQRRPLYAEVANVRIDAALPTAAQIDRILHELGRPCRWPDDSRHA